MNIWVKGTGLIMSLALAGCGQDDAAQEPVELPGESAAAPQAQPGEGGPVPDQAQAGQDCEPDGELRYICDVQNAEDLLLLGDTGLVLASGMSRGDITGHLYLIDPMDESVSELIFGGGFSAALDSAAYPECPSLINLGNFSIHGLSLREYEDNRFDLYVTSHGAREAIEIFDLDMSGEAPALTWKGCVPLPENTFANSVAILEDGGFVTTKMMDPREGFAPINNGEISGLVYEWHPGGEVMEVPGTELSGANGIVLSDDERYMYVAAMGSREMVRFDRMADPVEKAVLPLGIVPDNVRWGDEGTLLVAGGNAPAEGCTGPDCASGWSVVEVDADLQSARSLATFGEDVAIQGVSSALIVGDEIWVGTFNGNRIARFPR